MGYQERCRVLVWPARLRLSPVPNSCHQWWFQGNKGPKQHTSCSRRSARSRLIFSSSLNNSAVSSSSSLARITLDQYCTAWFKHTYLHRYCRYLKHRNLRLFLWSLLKLVAFSLPSPLQPRHLRRGWHLTDAWPKCFSGTPGAVKLQCHRLFSRNVQLPPQGAEFWDHGFWDPHLPLGQAVCIHYQSSDAHATRSVNKPNFQLCMCREEPLMICYSSLSLFASSLDNQ